MSAGGSISNNNDMSENCEHRGPGPPPELELTEAGHKDRRNAIGLCAASGHARTQTCFGWKPARPNSNPSMPVRGFAG